MNVTNRFTCTKERIVMTNVTMTSGHMCAMGALHDKWPQVDDISDQCWGDGGSPLTCASARGDGERILLGFGAFW